MLFLVGTYLFRRVVVSKKVCAVEYASQYSRYDKGKILLWC